MEQSSWQYSLYLVRRARVAIHLQSVWCQFHHRCQNQTSVELYPVLMPVRLHFLRYVQANQIAHEWATRLQYQIQVCSCK